MAYAYQKDNNKYHFTAKNEVEYTVHLASLPFPPDLDSPISELLHEIAITPIVDDHGERIKGSGNDPDFPETVSQIVAGFFLEKEDAIIVYLSNPTAGLHKARNRIFTRWHRKFNPNERVSKIDIDCFDVYLVSLLFLPGNRHKKDILEKSSYFNNHPHKLLEALEKSLPEVR